MSFLDRNGLRLTALGMGLLLAMPWAVDHLLLRSLGMLIAAALLCFGLMPWVIALAHRLGAVDIPSARRVHRQPTPRLGGVAVLFAVNLTLLLNFNYSLELKGVCISAIAVALISFFDDLHSVSAGKKLLVQILACALMMGFGVHVELAPDTWWGYTIEFGITLLWMVGITNAYNFLDGINGLAASLAVAVSFLMGMLALLTGQEYMLLLCLAVAGAAFGFMPDNARYRQPARIFLGDSGSTYLGWMMAGIAVMGDWSSEGPIKAFSAPVLIFSVMIFDMIYTTIARIARGDVRSVREWIDYVGRDHLHHRFLALGYEPPYAVGAVVALCIVTGLAALALVMDSGHMMWMLLGQAVAIYVAVSVVMVHVVRQRANGG